MSGSTTSMHDIINVLRMRVPPEIHPSAQAIIGEYFGEMRDAADRGLPHQVIDLIGRIRWRIVDELRWEAEKSISCGDYREAYKLGHRADRVEASHAWV